MPTLDIFNSDAFSVQSLTSAINMTPEGESVNTMLDSLFSEEGVTTTAISIERENDSLAMVEDRPRGSDGAVVVGNKRDLVPFNTLHLPVRAVVRADEVQGIRAFGAETEVQTVQSLINKRLAKLRRMIDTTLTFHKLGAVTGRIYDANGTRVLLDLYQRFEIDQQTQAMALGSATTDVAGKIRSAMRKVEDAIGGTSVITGWTVVCGRGFYDAFVSHAKVEKAFERWQDGAFLRNDLRQGFTFQNVVWKEYYGKVGNIEFLGADDAYLIPTTSDNIFQTFFAPADHIDTVNTIGLPYYATMEHLNHGKGVEIEAQSNPLTICTRPRAIVQLTKA